jgi:hypothetical protein
MLYNNIVSELKLRGITLDDVLHLDFDEMLWDMDSLLDVWGERDVLPGLGYILKGELLPDHEDGYDYGETDYVWPPEGDWYDV